MNRGFDTLFERCGKHPRAGWAPLPVRRPSNGHATRRTVDIKAPAGMRKPLAEAVSFGQDGATF
jgi:hypothetical protein